MTKGTSCRKRNYHNLHLEINSVDIFIRIMKLNVKGQIIRDYIGMEIIRENVT